MSEASTDRADRPAEVTDPLLWSLAAAVADAHQPDEERICVSPSCVGASWPCAAWNSAQEGLRAARAPRAAGPVETAGVRRDDPLPGWSTGPASTVPAQQLATAAA
ncbi:hypothetical protein [Micromonospora sp. HK10]|uniref:hypothetical protein n=1 Tax=Micromonospora sp. HK10 TaxID=1538294 RepID=UPI000626FEAC|nr:hypothetical protein [Micromonospora sp. HK10]